jgi:hypothetical protein
MPSVALKRDLDALERRVEKLETTVTEKLGELEKQLVALLDLIKGGAG